MARSGCRLREVGTTNRTHLEDYAAAIGPKTGCVLKVHTSNYVIQGFTASVPEADLAALVPRALAFPLSSTSAAARWSTFRASVCRTSRRRAKRCARARTSSRSAATSSSAGRRPASSSDERISIARIRKNPLKRALRVDKMTLAALDAVLQLYLDPDRLPERLPTLRAPDAARAKSCAPLAARLRRGARKSASRSSSSIARARSAAARSRSGASRARVLRCGQGSRRRPRRAFALCRSRSSAACTTAHSCWTCAASTTKPDSSRSWS